MYMEQFLKDAPGFEPVPLHAPTPVGELPPAAPTAEKPELGDKPIEELTKRGVAVVNGRDDREWNPDKW